MPGPVTCVRRGALLVLSRNLPRGVASSRSDRQDGRKPRSLRQLQSCKRDLGPIHGSDSDQRTKERAMPRPALRRYFRHGLFPQLMVFEAVARLRSVTRAAGELHLAQPTVSTQLRKLSESLGLALFEQRGRSLEATPAGGELRRSCEELIGLLERLEARLAP